MFVVVSYDVVDDRRRNRLSKALKAFGDRVQRSVFECNVDQVELEKMVTRIRKLTDDREDTVRIYRLCASCKSAISICGYGTVSEDPDLIVV